MRPTSDHVPRPTGIAPTIMDSESAVLLTLEPCISARISCAMRPLPVQDFAGTRGVSL